ncbi:MAG: prolyl oligopeptidase family serine peptidase [Alphaproteobacteria bacterium]|nr:prolyl oligopeptidase family serine peptidase [Alphaproteobacteria bacterium]
MRTTPILVAALATASLALPAATSRPAPAPVKPVTETLWGQKVTDNYRYMEAMGPETVSWMKAEGAYTRAVMDSIKPHAALLKRVGDFTGSFGFIQGYATFGGRAFYEERAPGSDNFDLMVKDAKGARKIVDIAAIRAAHGGNPYAINYFLASPDGSKVAVGVSEGGSEAASISVYDAASGKQIAGPVDRAEFGATAWSGDSKLVYFIRLKKLAAGEPAVDKYKNATADAWNLTSAPVPVAGNGIGKGTSFLPDENPAIAITPGAPLAALLSLNGVQNEWKVWTAPAATASTAEAPWKLLIDRQDGVTGADMRGDEIFLLSHKDAPTFKVLVLKAGEPLSAAKVLVPAARDRVIEGVHAAADALYVLARRGAYSELLRIPTGTTRIETVALPARGHVTEAFTDPRQAGIAINFSSWVLPPQEYSYDPKSGRFTDLKIEAEGDFNPAAYTVSDLQAKAHDGVMVPLSLIRPKNASTPQIAIIEAYGSYGISELADFSPRRAAVMKEGVAYGICHVRGGGELGEAWRLGGKDANKHNTWQDLVACGRDLIARGITTKDKLFIIGGSAGGITMGRAMEDAPDLFAGVIDIVPAANTLRAEFSPNGPPNIPEFGTIKNEQGFKNLYAMDSIQHVKKGVAYPAIMISTGLNDPRVSPWEPAKFATALQASGTPNPVLLRIDEQAGHGIGSTKTQTDKLTADWIAFIFWRAGEAAWQPSVK